jgi:hypothetical protein
MIGMAFLTVLSVTLCIMLYRDNSRLSALLSQEQFGQLSPDVRNLIVSDLRSSNLARIAPWESYFSHTLDLESNLHDSRMDLKALVQLYSSHEQTGRSNHFADLLVALSSKQQTMGLTTHELITYLGNPDATQDVSLGKIFIYHFSSYGRPAIAQIRATNDTILRVGFNILPNTSQE